MKKVCVMGLGYIGLPTASFLGTKGYQVHGVDISPNVVETINRGDVHITEPELDVLVKSAVQSGNLTAALEPAEADIFIIAVPTPLNGSNEPEMSAVTKATDAISPYLKRGNIVILESTSPVGTTDRLVADRLRELGHKVGDEIHVAHCPERVLPGRILAELVGNDRIVGGIDDTSTTAAADFYREFVAGEVLETTAATAELAKLSENTFRDVNIALANELSMICDDMDVDVWDLITLANRHPRVSILQPGPGVGGHCIAVDPWFIVAAAPSQARLIRTAREVNIAKPEWVVDKIRARAEKFKRPTIACLGLAYKADIDDLRESPALDVVEKLREADLGELLISEPYVKSHPDYDLVDWQEAVQRADIVVVLVDHRQFKGLKPKDLQERVLIDTRGMLR